MQGGMHRLKFQDETVLNGAFQVIFMASQTLQDYMCQYMDEKSERLKGCLVAALESKEGYLCILVESLGTPVVSEDLRYSELLANAGLFWVEEKITRNGRNRYKLFHLTDVGRRIAKQTKVDGFDGELAQSVEAV
jgi:hypothetical protein